MNRLYTAALAALVGCESPAIEEAPPVWVYAPPIPSGPLAPVRAHVGRGQSPQLGSPAGIIAELPLHPLRLPTPWAVPGPGRARAVLYGVVDDAPAIELIEIDNGRVAWRDTTACAGPIVGVAAEAVVCADVHGTRAVGIDGKPRWRNDEAFIAMTNDRVVTAGADGFGVAIVREALSGDELARIKLPAGLTADAIVATCGDAGRELFAIDQDGKLVRIAEGYGGPAVSWSTPMGAVLGIDACDGDAIVLTGPGTSGLALVSVTRATGKITGRLDAVRGYWKARDVADRLEVSTAAGVASWTRDLTAGVPVALPSLGELLATRGDRRLVRATPLTAALLDRDGTRAYLPLAALGAALGDDALVAATWLGSPSETVHRIGLPPAWPHRLRAGPPRAGISVPAELRDLPAEKPLDLAAAITRNGTAMHDVAGAALEGDALYVIAVERTPDDTNGGGVLRLDLATRSWRWHRPDGCGPGTPIGIALGRVGVVCGARVGLGHALVRATSRDGEPRWDWPTANLDAIAAAGDVVLVFDADRLNVIDADGRFVGAIASDDTARVRAAAVEVAGTTWLATYERGRVVGRLPRAAMVPVWSLAVDGAVSAISPAGAGFVVELVDGDASWIDARTGAVVALPGVGLAWQGFADVVAGATAGGPIPPVIPAAPPRVLPPPPPRAPAKPLDFEAPPIATPVQAPPPIGIAWQYTLYDIGGGLRARNDYAIAPPVVATPIRGPSGSPLVLRYGSAFRGVIVLEPQHGNPVSRVQLTDDVAFVFATVVDGRPTAGAVLSAPLRVVLF